MQLNSEASEIFAEFTLGGLPADVRASLTPVQIAAIRKVLVEQHSRKSHILDLRLTFPLFFRKYYLVFLIGRDRRKSTDAREKRRIDSTPLSLRKILVGSAVATVFAAFGLATLAALYLVKVALGIDIFPGFHLRDVLESFMNIIDAYR